MGTVQRTRANSERIFAISYQLLQVIDAQFRDTPKVTATLELCNNIVDIIPINNYCVQIISDNDYFTGNSKTKLRTVSSTEPDSSEYLAEQIVSYNILRTYTNGNFIYLVCSEYLDKDQTMKGRILVYDYSNPFSPKLRSDFIMNYFTEYYYYGYYYPPGELADQTFCQVDGDLIIYHPDSQSNYEEIYADDDEVEIYEDDYYNETTEPKPEEKTSSRRYYSKEMNTTEKLYIISLSDADEADTIATITLENTSRITGMQYNGKSLYLLQYEDTSYYDKDYNWHYESKNYLTKVDLTEPAEPALDNPINIPGEFLGISDDGTIIFTRSSTYDKDYNWEQSLNVLKVNKGKAILASALDLGNSNTNIFLEDTTIILCYGDYGYWGYGYYEKNTVYALDGGVPRSEEFEEPEIKTKIQIIDAQNPENLLLKTTIGLQTFCYVYKVDNEKLILQLSESNGILIYDISEISSPEFRGYYPIYGYINNLRAELTTGRIYIACGWYGVLTVEVLE